MGHKRMSDLPAILLAFSRVRSLRQAPAAVMLWASWPWPLTESAVIHPIIKYPSSKCSAYNSLNMNDLIQKLDDNAADLKHSITYRARQYPSPTTVRSAFFLGAAEDRPVRSHPLLPPPQSVAMPWLGSGLRCQISVALATASLLRCALLLAPHKNGPRMSKRAFRRRHSRGSSLQEGRAAHTGPRKRPQGASGPSCAGRWVRAPVKADPRIVTRSGFTTQPVAWPQQPPPIPRPASLTLLI